MPKAKTRNYIKISSEEYAQLKQLKGQFKRFLKYAAHAQDIEQARNNIKLGQTISQEKLFKALNI